MKKTLFIVLAFLCILTTGCNEKKLVCTSKEPETGRTQTNSIVISFKGQDISKVKKTIEIVFEEKYKKAMDTYYNAMKEQYKGYKKENGYTVKSSKDENTILFNIIIDMKIQEGSEIKDNIIDAEGSRNTIKKQLTNSGYTCE